MTSKPIAKRKAKVFKGTKKPKNASNQGFLAKSLVSRVVAPLSATAHCTLLGLKIRYPGETIYLKTNQYHFDIECYYLGDQLKLPNDLLFKELEGLEYVVPGGQVFHGIHQLVDSQELVDAEYDPKLPVHLDVTMVIFGELIDRQKRVIHLAWFFLIRLYEADFLTTDTPPYEIPHKSWLVGDSAPYACVFADM